MSNEFVVYTGPMFAAKTSRLLLHLELCKHKGMQTFVFKPRRDDRFEVDAIKTHSGQSMPATSIKNGSQLLSKILNQEFHKKDVVIAVDEAFMIPGISTTLIYLYRVGYNVIVSSIDMSSTGKPFAEIEKLLPWATRIEKCIAACSICNKDAAYTYKKNVSEEEIQIGGSDIYEARCRICHPTISSP